MVVNLLHGGEANHSRRDVLTRSAKSTNDVCDLICTVLVFFRFEEILVPRPLSPSMFVTVVMVTPVLKPYQHVLCLCLLLQ